MGFWETLGRGVKAAAEHAEKERIRKEEMYNRYSTYDDQRLKDIYTNEDDGWFSPSPKEKAMAARVLRERGYGKRRD